VLIFVSSRRQTRLTALDLIAFLAGDDQPRQFLHMNELEVTLSFPIHYTLLFRTSRFELDLPLKSIHINSS